MIQSLGVCSEQGQTSKMEYFAKVVNGWKPLTISLKSSILDVWQDSKYASGHYTDTLM